MHVIQGNMTLVHGCDYDIYIYIYIMEPSLSSMCTYQVNSESTDT